MKNFTLTKIDIYKLYFFIFIAVLIYVLSMIILVKTIVFILPNFEYVNWLFIITSIIYGHFAYTYSFDKTSQEIQIIINPKKININDNIIQIDDIRKIYLKGNPFSFYPKIIFLLTDKKKLVFRLSKDDKDYLEFINWVNQTKL